jgi:hypothetical protein
MNTDQKEINTVGSVDILKKRQRCLKRYRLKLSPRIRVWRIRLRSDRPGARAQSLRFSEEKGSRSERDAGKAVVGMPGVFRRTLGGCARFSFRAWRESRSAPHVSAGCRYDFSRCRIRRRPRPTRWEFPEKRLRRPQANSHSRSRGRVARSATAGTADTVPRRPLTSASAATAAVFAHNRVSVIRKKCSPLRAPSPFRRRPHELACDRDVANRATGSRSRQPLDR